MGVHQLWKVLEPSARPVLLESLRGKTLAIDASIWIYHFLKAMRDASGNAMRAGHIIGFFRRICKLLFYEIRPVFVFDGAAPAIKRITTDRRKHRAHKRREGAKATANRILTLQLQRMAKEKKEKKAAEKSKAKVTGDVPSNVTYYEEPQESRPFVPQDQYDLPDLAKIQPIRLNDQRLLTDEELDEYAKKFTSQARSTGFIDSETIDFHSFEFKNLPIESQYQLLNEARLKSRLRMGYTSSQLGQMFPNSMEFSKFQIERVSQRNFFTQKLMNLVGLEDDLTTRRVNSEKGKEYMLQKQDGGYIMSLGTHGSATEPKQEVKEEESESDDEFEDVDLDPVGAQTNGDVQQVLAELVSSQEIITEEPFEKPKPPSTERNYLEELYGFEVEDEKPKVSKRRQPEPEPEPQEEVDPVQNDDYDADWSHTLSQELPVFSGGGSLFSQALKKRRQEKLRESSQSAQEPSGESSQSVTKTEPVQDVEKVEADNPGESCDQKPEAVAAAESAEAKTSSAVEPIDLTVGSPSPAHEEHADVLAVRSHEPVDLPQPGALDKPVEESPDAPVSGSPKPELIDVIEPTEQPDPPQEAAGSGSPTAPTPEPFALEATPELEETEKALAEQEAEYDEEQEQDIQNVMVEELEENERFVEALSRGQKAANYAAEIDRLKNVYHQEKRDADNVTDDMVRECMELLQLFGIPYVSAPGEAEAQCAELYELKLVDGVVTDDGDCFLFGDVKVFRNLFNQAKYVEAYESKVIQKELGLDRSKLISLAYLLGSDYTDGIVGVGPVTGVELLADFNSLEAFRDWWLKAQRYPEEADLSTTFKKRFHKKFASKLFLPEHFPDQLVAESYWHPNVDPDDTQFEWGRPDIKNIAKFMKMTSGWDSGQVNQLLMPVVEEQKRRDMLNKQTGKQSTLDEFAQINKQFRSKRAAAATERLKK